MRLFKPVALFATALALVVAVAISASPASGNTTSVTATAAGTGGTLNVIASYTNSPAGAPATLTATGPGVFASATASGGTGVSVSGTTFGSTTLTTTPDTSGIPTNTITIQATFTCQSQGQVTFTLTQAGGTPGTATSTPVLCSAAGTTGTTGGLTVTPASAAPGQQVTISGTCQQGATLSAQPALGSFVNATVNGQPAQGSATGVMCTTAGTLNAMFMCSQQGQVTFTLGGATGTLSCGSQAGATAQQPYNPNNPYNQQQPYLPNANPALNQAGNINNMANPSGANSASPVSIQVSPSTLACGSTGAVTISARGPDGQAVQQGQVSLYTTSGALEPKTGALTNGKFETKLIAASTGGTATISASVNGVTNNVDVKVDCAGGSAPASSLATNNAVANSLANSPASPPPPPAARSLENITISPPSTGDGGLLPAR